MHNVTTRKWMLIILALALLLAATPLFAACDDDDDNDGDEITTSLVSTTTTESVTTTTTTELTTTQEPTTTEPAGELLTIDSKLGDLLANPDAKAILEKYLPPDIMSKAGYVSSFSLPELAPQSSGRVDDEMLAAMAADLEALGAYSTTAAPTTAPTTAPTKTTSKLTGEPVKIGVLSAWSGSMGIAGLLLDQVVEVCDYLIEERGGVLGGRPVEWVKIDSGGDIAKAEAGCQKLASDDDVMAITIGGVTAGESVAVTILTSELRIPYFSIATWTELSEYPYAVRAGSVVNTERARLCAEYALENFDPDTVAFLAESTEDCHDGIDRAKAILEDAGVEIVYEQYLAYGTMDVNPYLTAIRAEEPDVLIHFIANGSTCVDLYKHITGLGGWGDTKVVSISGHPTNAATEIGAQGTYYWAHWIPGLPYPGDQAFEQAWQAVHGEAPNAIIAPLFQAIWSAVEAVDQAGADREDIAHLIRSGNFSWETPSGKMVIGTDGENNQKGFIAEIKDGQSVLAPEPD